MSDYLVARSTALVWRWRCKADGELFAGSDLRVVDVRRGSLLPLEESDLREIERGALRHTCGSQEVVPVAPVYAVRAL